MYVSRLLSSRRIITYAAELRSASQNTSWREKPHIRRNAISNFHTTNHRLNPGPVSSLLADTLPSVLVPPVVFTGLLVALWTYKAFMTVIGQNKIIYMPYMPPFTRSEVMADYLDLCKPAEWRYEKIRSLDGTKLAICVGQIAQPITKKLLRHIVIVHFHGNGGSLPPRLPLLSSFLKAIQSRADAAQVQAKFTLVALSPRGYWKSSGRASQKGIEKDAQAVLQWASSSMSAEDEETELVLWGQSLGAGVATTAAATWLKRQDGKIPTSPRIIGLLLETPFTSIKSMLLTLYPQKWLPYRYLHPFLWNHWDSPAALAEVGAVSAEQRQIAPKVLLMIAEKDEVVPAEEATKMEKACERAGLDWTRKDAAGALHVDALAKSSGRDQAAKWIVEVVGAKDSGVQ